jgi:isopenicillin-N epimerase
VNCKGTGLPKRSNFGRYWGLSPGTVFLNHGSFGACPKPILRLQQELRAQMEAEPAQFLWRRYEERLEPSRREVAKLVGVDAKDLVFITNATTAINAVIRSAGLRPGDRVLTTSHDYNACRNALAEAVQRARAELVVAPVPFPLTSAEQVTEAVLGALTPKTRLAMLDHVTSSTGLILPLARLLAEFEKRGILTLVDGAHAPGMLPLNITALNPSWYTGNLHKWVCAPKGAAFLWAREDHQAVTQPAVVSHGNNTPRPGYTPFQDRFDWAGTLDPTPWMCAGPASQWMAGRLPGGWPEVRRRNHELVVRARQLLCQRLGVEPPCPEEMVGSMATLPLPPQFQGKEKSGKIDIEQLELHDRFRIEVPFFRFGQPEQRLFRISAQLYNALAEYEYLGKALEQTGLVPSVPDTHRTCTR